MPTLQLTNSREKVDDPNVLYHASRYKHDVLKPGYDHSGVLVKWDNTESNRWLYATTSEEEAIALGIASALEKRFHIDHFRLFQSNRITKRIIISIPSTERLTVDDIYTVPVYLYKIKFTPRERWVRVNNALNLGVPEYKTIAYIKDNILECKEIDVKTFCAGYRIEIRHSKRNNE